MLVLPQLHMSDWSIPNSKLSQEHLKNFTNVIDCRLQGDALVHPRDISHFPAQHLHMQSLLAQKSSKSNFDNHPP